jgi:hypothetical protein
MLYVVWFIVAPCIAVGAQERSISGEYRNYAEGFSVKIPSGLRGMAGDQAGPERGVRIPLPSGAFVTIYGEPNSAEYKTAEEGVRDSLSGQCDSEIRVAAARVGKVPGAKGTIVCGERVIVAMLAFRPGGGPVYWLKLETTNDQAKADEAKLTTIARGFEIIAWR